MSSTTLPDLAVNAMNKVINLQWSLLERYRWYETVISLQPNDGTLQDMQWITLGGVENLPTVNEKGAYTELDLSDVRESDSWHPKHGWWRGPPRFCGQCGRKQ